MNSLIHYALSILLTLLSTATLTQPDAQTAFAQLKSLAGTWEGTMTTVPPHPEVNGKNVHVTLRVTSTGHALMHELTIAGRPDDPITMLYMDDGRLTLTHFCDAGNRPRMVAKPSADGKTVEFELVDVAGSLKYGHMHHAAFTVVDADHHTEEWTFMFGEDKHVIAHAELHRVK